MTPETIESPEKGKSLDNIFKNKNLQTILWPDSSKLNTLQSLFTSLPNDKKSVLGKEISVNFTNLDILDTDDKDNVLRKIEELIKTYSSTTNQENSEHRENKEGTWVENINDPRKKIEEHCTELLAKVEKIVPKERLQSTQAYKKAQEKFKDDPQVELKATLSASLSPDVRRELKQTLPETEYRALSADLQSSAQSLGVHYDIDVEEYHNPNHLARAEEAIAHSAPEGSKASVDGHEVHVGDNVWDAGHYPPTRSVEGGSGLRVPADTPYEPAYELAVEEEKFSKHLDDIKGDFKKKTERIDAWKKRFGCATERDLYQYLAAEKAKNPNEPEINKMIEELNDYMETRDTRQEEIKKLEDQLEEMKHRANERIPEYQARLDRAAETARENLKYMEGIAIGALTDKGKDIFIHELNVNHPNHQINLSEPLTPDDQKHILKGWQELLAGEEENGKIAEKFKDNEFDGDVDDMKNLLIKRRILLPNGNLDDAELTRLMRQSSNKTETPSQQ